MLYHPPELSAQEVLRHTPALLEEKRPWKAEGDKGATDELFKVLVGVAATQSTLEAVCAELVGTPDPQTLRGSFNDQLRGEDLPDSSSSGSLRPWPPRAPPCPPAEPGSGPRLPCPARLRQGGTSARTLGPRDSPGRDDALR